MKRFVVALSPDSSVTCTVTRLTEGPASAAGVQLRWPALSTDSPAGTGGSRDHVRLSPGSGSVAFRVATLLLCSRNVRLVVARAKKGGVLVPSRTLMVNV